MTQLTDRQAEVLDVVVTWVLERGYPPTLREIGAALGIRSTNGVSDHLRTLERKGYLERDPRSSRGINLLRLPSGEPTSRRLRQLLQRAREVLVSEGDGAEVVAEIDEAIGGAA